MGAQFQFETLTATSDETAVTEGQAIIEKDAWDYGHAGYTGTFAECTGVEVVTEHPPFKGEEEAREWLIDAAEKWGPMLIVKDKDGVRYAGAWCSS